MSTIFYFNETTIVLDIRPYDGTMFAIHADAADGIIAAYDVVEDSEYGVTAVRTDDEMNAATDLGIHVHDETPESIYRLAIVAAIAAI